MESLLGDNIPGTLVYMDDILVMGKYKKEHLWNLDALLTRLKKEGLTLKKPKCKFMMILIEYLGHIISEKGLQTSLSKTKAITSTPECLSTMVVPEDGKIYYYSKFVEHLSSKLAPLYNQIKKKSKWKMGYRGRQSVQLGQAATGGGSCSEHYNPTKLLTLATDAYPYGIGAVLSHVKEDGSEKPVAYASRTLYIEKRYSQLDKEALAIILGIKCFHQYLYGRQFFIVSDNKLLQYLLSKSRAVLTMSSARLGH